MTLDEVHELAAKGDSLQASDLPNLRPSMLSSSIGGYNPTLYGVEGGYRLLINFNDTVNPDSGINSATLESIWASGGSGIDIRYGDVDEFIRTHPSRPADVVPSTAFDAREWVNMQNTKYSLDFPVELTLEEFPGVLFGYTPERLTATENSGTRELFGGKGGFIFGGYIENIYLADLNGDGKPEFCGTTTWGSGFSDTHVIVFDYANDKGYIFADRGVYDYFLQMAEGQLQVIQMLPMQQFSIPYGVGSLAIIDGELVVFGISRATEPQENAPPLASGLSVTTSPSRYTTEMSHDVGIQIDISYDKPFTNVRYRADNGSFVTHSGGVVTLLDSDVIVLADTPVYWTPWVPDGDGELQVESDTITLTVLLETNALAETVLPITRDIEGFYIIGEGVRPSNLSQYEVGSVAVVSNGRKYEPYKHTDFTEFLTDSGKTSTETLPLSLEEAADVLPEIQIADDFRVVVTGQYATSVLYSLYSYSAYDNSFSLIYDKEDTVKPFLNLSSTREYMLCVYVIWSNSAINEQYREAAGIQYVFKVVV
jgi:hypothetical protein